MFQATADAGFDSIRLPVRWSAHAATDAPYTIEKTFFDRVDWAIAHALTRGLKIVVDMHHYGNEAENLEGIYDHPAEHHDRFLGLWKQIAEHYKDYPKELYFEVLNEPRGALAPLWNDYLAEAVAIIRETNPGRTLVAGGVEWNKFFKLSSVNFPDENIIATYHYYNPYCFTLQNQFWEAVCKTPDGSDPKTDGVVGWPVIWPDLDPNPTTTATTVRALLESDMRAAATWATASHRPLYLGEFGVSLVPPGTNRADWTASIVKVTAELGISWNYWQFTSEMGIWDLANATFNPTMLEALKAVPDNTGSGGTGGAGGAGGAGTTSGNDGGTTGQVTTTATDTAGSSSGGNGTG
jgi:endoglucanase